ncbi:MAG: undecaprenyl-diphosphate phosphatase [Gammaproteobacteria bacterium]|nr:undecaprenyl-diphosphate phosphatase [Gammaproteobacteria bacterium]
MIVDGLLLIKAILLGIIEGMTEFLPVSSTGHLIIFGDLLGFTGDSAKTFEIFIQLGSILGVLWLYRHKVIGVARTLDQPASQRFVLNLFIAFMPAAVVGLLFHGAIKEYLFNPTSVAGALVVGGILILVIERRRTPPRIHTADDLRPLDAFKVGLAQCCALYPGVSRSGATIMGGLLAGLSRTAATEFSFFLAIPTMFAATLYELYKSRDLLHASDVPVFAAGFIAAFLTAMAVVKLFLAYVARHDFTAFAYYRIGFGILVLAYFW